MLVGGKNRNPWCRDAIQWVEQQCTVVLLPTADRAGEESTIMLGVGQERGREELFNWVLGTGYWPGD